MSTAAAYAGSVPEHYEHELGPILFEPYARYMAGRLPPGSRSVLELACGTGRVTRHLLAHLPATGRLLATDLNPDMLTVARRLLQDPRLHWAVADAQALPFDAGSFDAVVFQFGLMFIPDKPMSLREALRVLRPGGSLCCSTWDSMAHNPRAGIIADVMQEVMGSEAPDFLAKGPYSLYDEAELRVLLVHAGFRDVRIENVALESTCSDPAALIRGYVDGSPLGQYLDKKGGGLRALVKERLYTAFEAQAGTFGNRVPMRAWIAEATR